MTTKTQMGQAANVLTCFTQHCICRKCKTNICDMTEQVARDGIALLHSLMSINRRAHQERHKVGSVLQFSFV